MFADHFCFLAAGQKNLLVLVEPMYLAQLAVEPELAPAAGDLMAL
jgi:hypothetical protein